MASNGYLAAFITTASLGTLGVSAPAFAGYLATSTKITRIANTSSNNSAFAVLVAGGSGQCTNGGWISFHVSTAPDPDTQSEPTLPGCWR
jgi:hypothetical protein